MSTITAPLDLAHFATRWLPPNTEVITARGEIDATNSQDFVAYALRNGDRIKHLVLDLRGIEFFGTSGFSALDALNVRCAEKSIEWASVPSDVIARLLKICDPDSTLPFYASVDTALSAVSHKSAPLLQLVPEPR